MATISLNYEKVMGEVNRLKTVVSELQKAQADAKNAVNNMGSYWEGQAAGAFSTATQKWCAEMKSIEAEADALARLIKKVADDIRAAEQRALDAINNS